jgi:hypothetical protein
MKKLICGLIVGLMVLFGGTIAAATPINDGILYEFRSRSVVVFPDIDMFATGVNYKVDTVDGINMINPWVGIFTQFGEMCMFYMTMYAQFATMSTPISCDSMPEIMQDNPEILVGHWFPYNNAELFYTDKLYDAAFHIDLFWDFVNKEYNEAQRP